MNPIIKKNGTTYGIILAVFGIVVTTTTYVMQMYSAWWISLTTFIVAIAIYCVMMSKTKKELGGIYSFKDAFTTYFLAAVISTFISTTFNITLYNFVDPEAKEIVKEHTIKSTVSIMEKLGTPSSQINKTVEDLEKDDPLSIGKQAFGGVIGLAVSCLLGLVLAAIFKSGTTPLE